MSSVAKKKTQKSAPAKAPAPTKSKPVSTTSAPKAPVISLLVETNPKRGNSAKRFAYYSDGLLVSDYVAKVVKAGNHSGVARADLRWDTERKFIAIR
jgi:hypothetical protein